MKSRKIRREACLVLRFRVSPSMHPIVEVNDAEMHALRFCEGNELLWQARVTDANGARHQVYIRSAFELASYLRKVIALDRVTHHQDIRQIRIDMRRAHL